jgi:hypothetical protein
MPTRPSPAAPKVGGPGPDLRLAEDVLRRVRADGEELDAIRNQAVDAVESPSGHRILHGLLEETIDRFRASSMVTMDGMKAMMSLVTENQQRLNYERQENEKLRNACAQLEANGNALAENMEANIQMNHELEMELEGALEELNNARADIERLERKQQEQQQQKLEQAKQRAANKNSPKSPVPSATSCQPGAAASSSSSSSRFANPPAPAAPQMRAAAAAAVPISLNTDNSTAALLARVGQIIGEPISPTSAPIPAPSQFPPPPAAAAFDEQQPMNDYEQQPTNDYEQQPMNEYSDDKYQAMNLKPFQAPSAADIPTPQNTPVAATKQKSSPPKRDTSPPVRGAPNIGAAKDPNLAAKKLLHRLHKYTVDNQIDMNRQWKKMDINGDGFLSFDELFDAMKTLGLEVAFSDVLILHKFLAGDQELVSLHDFFTHVQQPPEIEKRNDSTVPKYRTAVQNVNIDAVKAPERRYDYGTGAGLAVANPALQNRGEQKKLGDLAANPNRRRSQEAREDGWLKQTDTSTKADGTFGNVFEYQAIEARNEHRKKSTFMFDANTAAAIRKMPPCPDGAANVFKKIAAYIKNHAILMDDVRDHINVHRDGRLNAKDLKKQIVTKIGVQLSVAESQFIFKYLSSLTDGEYASLEDLEASIVQHKPAKGGYKMK